MTFKDLRARGSIINPMIFITEYRISKVIEHSVNMSELQTIGEARLIKELKELVMVRSWGHTVLINTNQKRKR